MLAGIALRFFVLPLGQQPPRQVAGARQRIGMLLAQLRLSPFQRPPFECLGLVVLPLCGSMRI